ncbi:MarR family winged helix-turn-helix transcriptional regulator [Jiangella alba]|uniref:DNA-binding transcriptional regulator, MarR family n=1 Tax=Jiangella alba TaxID=561176 RepID=A0A1H5PRV5_9ACTN|nr:MarR family transcriptional regulator [Jiangella alba]SEF16592.1 DNA-binding transcriptional regulator, MarR family [Jiangella alba]
MPAAKISQNTAPQSQPARSGPAQPRTQAGLASSLRIAVGRLNRRIRNQREDDALTLNQLSALGILERKGPLPVGELAACERIRPPSMTRIVSGLEELGLAVREPDLDDRRVINVRITEAGKARTAADRKRRDAWLTHKLRDLSPDERERLRAALPVLEKLAGL